MNYELAPGREDTKCLHLSLEVFTFIWYTIFNEMKGVPMEHYIVLDTETANSLEEPLVYDLGFIVVDKDGNEKEAHSLTIAEIFLDKGLIASAYYNEKVPQYWDEIKDGKRTLCQWYTARKILMDCIKTYKVKKIFAHNMFFDYKALNTTQRYLTKSKHRWFFPRKVELWCTLKMARRTIGQFVDYDEFCFDNDFLTEKGNNRFTAEVLYRYLTNNIYFTEKHTGIDDVRIEKIILLNCLAIDKKVKGRLFDNLLSHISEL